MTSVQRLLSLLVPFWNNGPTKCILFWSEKGKHPWPSVLIAMTISILQTIYTVSAPIRENAVTSILVSNELS